MSASWGVSLTKIQIGCGVAMLIEVKQLAFATPARPPPQSYDQQETRVMLPIRSGNRNKFLVATAIVVALAGPGAAEARGWSHFGGRHGMNRAHLEGGRHADDAYAKAVSAEQDSLLRKLKNICKGC